MSHLNLAQRVKELRNKKGISQELLAEESGLSLRTIQRIEKNETVPRGDTLKRLAIALGTSPDEIIDWKIQEDQNYLTLMNLSAMSFLFFPLLGIIVPMTMWMSKKDKLKNVNELGKSILNFQISWALFLFLSYTILVIAFVVVMSGDIRASESSGISFGLLLWQSWIPVTIVFYIYNTIKIVFNTVRVNGNKSVRYKPSLKILK